MGRSRARTSCWVIVEAPRALPVSVSAAADRIPIGSKPAFCQKVLSSVLVVASIRTGGPWKGRADAVRDYLIRTGGIAE